MDGDAVPNVYDLVLGVSNWVWGAKTMILLINGRDEDHTGDEIMDPDMHWRMTPGGGGWRIGSRTMVRVPSRMARPVAVISMYRKYQR